MVNGPFSAVFFPSSIRLRRREKRPSLLSEVHESEHVPSQTRNRPYIPSPRRSVRMANAGHLNLAQRRVLIDICPDCRPRWPCRALPGLPLPLCATAGDRTATPYFSSAVRQPPELPPFHEKGIGAGGRCRSARCAAPRDKSTINDQHRPEGR